MLHCFAFIGWVSLIWNRFQIYKWYISDIYCQLGDYMVPTTYQGNQKQLLIQNWDGTSSYAKFLCPKSLAGWGQKSWQDGLPRWISGYFFGPWDVPETLVKCLDSISLGIFSTVTREGSLHFSQAKNLDITTSTFIKKPQAIWHPAGGVLGNSHSQDFLQLYQSLRTRMDIFIEVISPIQPTVRDEKKTNIIFHCCLIGIPIYNGILYNKPYNKGSILSSSFFSENPKKRKPSSGTGSLISHTDHIPSHVSLRCLW